MMMKIRNSLFTYVGICLVLSMAASCGPSDADKRKELEEKISTLESEMIVLKSTRYSMLVKTFVKSIIGGAIVGAGTATGALPIIPAGVAMVGGSFDDGAASDKAAAEYKAKEKERDAAVKELNKLRN